MSNIITGLIIMTANLMAAFFTHNPVSVVGALSGAALAGYGLREVWHD